MDTTGLLAILIGGWVLGGLAVAVVMGRRGHDLFTWVVVGIALGPLAAVPAMVVIKTGEHRPVETLAAANAPPTGTIDVVAGIDDSTASEAAILSAVDLLGSRIGRLSLVTVIEFGAPDQSVLRERRRAAERRLFQVAGQIKQPVSMLVLHGRPAPTLVDFAHESGSDLLVIGRRGHHARLVGSVAAGVTTQSKVSVLVGPD